MKIRNILFSAIVSIFLLGPFFLFVGQNVLKLDLPSWFTTEDATYLAGGVSGVDVKGNLSIEGLGSKKFQEAVEGTVGNSVPCKAKIMLANSALQRMGIKSSNALFGFDAYQTYYGKDKLYLPEADALAYIPIPRTEEDDQRIRAFSEGLARKAKEYPDIRFIVYVPGGLHTGTVNPAYKYVPNCYTNETLASVLREPLEASDNVFVMTDNFSDSSNYYDYYWKSDHHWNPLGASMAYNQMADEFDLPSFDPEGTVSIPIDHFSGRTAASSLDLVTESAIDIAHDFSDLTITSFDGTERYSGNDHQNFWETNELQQMFEFNALWLGSRRTSRIEGPGTGHAAIISDSFGAAMQRIIGEQYAITEVPWCMYGGEKGDDNLSDYITDETTEVYFIADYVNFKSFADRFPKFFE